jgi:hypothetical protein
MSLLSPKAVFTGKFPNGRFPPFEVRECDTLLFLVLAYLMRQLKLVLWLGSHKLLLTLKLTTILGLLVLSLLSVYMITILTYLVLTSKLT